MKQKLNIHLKLQHKKQIRQAFDLFDKEGTGRIPVHSLKVAIRALGYEPTPNEIEKMVNHLSMKFDDTEMAKNLTLEERNYMKKTIDFNEFLFLMVKKMGEKDSESETKKAYLLFKHYGKELEPKRKLKKNKSNYQELLRKETQKDGITRQDLECVAQLLGEDLNRDEISEILREGDRNMDGVIDEEEFLHYLSRCGIYKEKI